MNGLFSRLSHPTGLGLNELAYNLHFTCFQKEMEVANNKIAYSYYKLKTPNLIKQKGLQVRYPFVIILFGGQQASVADGR